MRPALFVALLLALPIPILACMWDSDTLATEAKGLPDVVRIITGRFERNPPRYYEMRLERVARRLAEDPADLVAYDDAGVACDRLGRGNEAIAWMDRKRAILDRADPSDPAVPEHRYRYLANVGTFWVHRWLRAGADRARIAEVETARDFIARAIELNPDAHFGREKYQLLAMGWIIAAPAVRTPRDNYPTTFYDVEDKSTPPAEAVRGLAGLIALGNAWESVDVFSALTEALQFDDNRTSMAMMARFRCCELIDAGRRSLLPGAPAGVALKGFVAEPMGKVEDERRLERTYLALRAEADAWHLRRADYMRGPLEAGRHPDTDPTFWDGYTDPEPPSLGPESGPSSGPDTPLRVATARMTSSRSPSLRLLLGPIVLASVVTPVAFVLVRRRSRPGPPKGSPGDWPTMP